MMNFKESCLFRDLADMKGKDILSENAWDFLDACADDWEVEYNLDFKYNTVEYTLKTVLYGNFNGKETNVETIYKGDLLAMCSVVEHLALVEDLLMREWLGA